MSFYTTNFLTLGIACSFLFFRQRLKHAGHGSANQALVDNPNAEATKLKNATSKFTRLYLVVYALTMGADWLQV